MSKDAFFHSIAQQGIALTYGDVRLKTGYCEVPPDQVSLATMFSRRVPLNIPIVSAAMDTVTESAMAIELAKLGGLGVIHNNLSPRDQAAETKRVWHYLHGLIDNPRTVQHDQTIEQVENWRRDKGWSFHSFPVLDEEGRLAGLLTRNDFDFCEDKRLPVSKVMTTDLITAPAGTSLDAAYEIMRREKKKIIPLVDSHHRLAGMYVFSDVQRIKSGSSSMYNVDGQGHLRSAAAVGIGDDAFERIELLGRYVSVVLISKAHGDFRDYHWTIREIKKKEWPFDVAAGNVSEGESAKRLVDAGADVVMVGQGPGSICTTRKVAGIGCPQVTAVYQCTQAIAGSGVPVCADGGIAFSGDIPVAIGAGAHSVMLGRVLAGTTEAPGELESRPVLVHGSSGESVQQVIQVKVYRGMGSLEAMQDRQGHGSRNRYSQSGPQMKVPEGVKAAVPYQGDVEDIVYQLLGGTRSGMAYVGAATIGELREKGDFWRITDAGERESHPHDVIMLADPPNYRRDGT